MLTNNSQRTSEIRPLVNLLLYLRPVIKKHSVRTTTELSKCVASDIKTDSDTEKQSTVFNDRRGAQGMFDRNAFHQGLNHVQ